MGLPKSYERKFKCGGGYIMVLHSLIVWRVAGGWWLRCRWQVMGDDKKSGLAYHFTFLLKVLSQKNVGIGVALTPWFASVLSFFKNQPTALQQ